jgi:hypothetical protein
VTLIEELGKIYECNILVMKTGWGTVYDIKLKGIY